MADAKNVKEAFDQSTIRFHVIATWVGALLNLFWWISDLIVLPSYSVNFLMFRGAVSGISLMLLWCREQLKLSIYFCMFILVSGISIQNAYMWSVMDVSHFQQHTLAYIVLFIGVGMLVLWKMQFSIALLVITIVSNVVFLGLNSQLTLDQILINGGLLTLTVVIFTMFLIRSRYRLTEREISIRLDLAESNLKVESQNTLLETKNREITDSIAYARNIQNALLPGDTKLAECGYDYFVLNMPKNIVSGDFYWAFETKNKSYYAVGDCTGHGVPGGFMTMLGLAFLEDIVVSRGISTPALILDELRRRIITALNQKGVIGENKDGMDISLYCIDKASLTLEFSGAYNDLHILRGNELTTLKAMRQPCGYSPNFKPFESKLFKLQAGDTIYATSDGYADQFGGINGKKLRQKKLLQLYLEVEHLPLADQKDYLFNFFEDWRGDLEQVDDVLMLAVKVK